MPYFVRAVVNFDFVGDARGNLMSPIVATIEIANTSIQGALVPNGNTPSAADFITARNAVFTDIGNQLAVQLPRLQSFALGGS